MLAATDRVGCEVEAAGEAAVVTGCDAEAAMLATIDQTEPTVEAADEAAVEPKCEVDVVAMLGATDRVGAEATGKAAKYEAMVKEQNARKK